MGDVHHPGPSHGGVQVVEGDPLAGQVPLDQLAVVNEHGGRGLQHATEALGAIRDFHQQAIEGEDDDGPEEAAAERVVGTDHRVLHDVRDDQQHHQVERRQLSHLALAGEPERRQQEQVDHHRPDDLLDDGHLGNEQVRHRQDFLVS